MAINELLTDEEVSALMQAVTDGAELSAPVPTALADQGLAYDFAAPVRIISGFAPTLAMINDRFMTAMRTSLVGMMQQFVDLTPSDIQVLLYCQAC